MSQHEVTQLTTIQLVISLFTIQILITNPVLRDARALAS